ncbi:hypothetical protein ACFFX0_11420 [Citricoccus parietis]|uniref:Uncharacterized protein n=1 Tax=Citricoccus parietis TaxID=592307 RepID=A0ABV5FYL0_9MICC
MKKTSSARRDMPRSYSRPVAPACGITRGACRPRPGRPHGVRAGPVRARR